MSGKEHYVALDGLRGFAAISVVIYHIGHWLNAPAAAPNSDVSVDIFFLLSGYVLAFSYRDRLDSTLSLSRFMAIRSIRLMPLVMLGALVSAAYALMRAHVKSDGVGIDAVGTGLFLSLVNLPWLTAPAALGDGVFPLNGPQYTLFFELVANAAWAGLAWLRTPRHAALLALAFFAFVAMGGELGGFASEDFLLGFPRVGASFLAGAALFQLDRALQPRRWWPLVFAAGCCLFTAVAYFPLRLPFPVLFAFIVIVAPVLVLAGARTTITGRFRGLLLWAGKLSYPIYILHYPIFVWMNGIFQTFVGRQSALVEGCLLLACVTLGSYAALRWYDEPIRRQLGLSLKRRWGPAPSAGGS